MKPTPVITLLTDFGLTDEYVGVMKGVIASISPLARSIDISHGVPPQDIDTATQMITAAYRFFPPKTIHVIVVDPGVGSTRAALAMTAAGQIFLAPDNGVLTEIARHDPRTELRRIEKRDLFLSPLSHTFHGRDIFASVAAHLANGIAFNCLGPVMNKCEMVQWENPSEVKLCRDGVQGMVVRIDHFGNLITNIDADVVGKHFPGKIPASVFVTLKGHRINGISTSYACVAKGETVVVIGSRNSIEIAVAGGNAAHVLGVKPREPVRLRVTGVGKENDKV